MKKTVKYSWPEIGNQKTIEFLEKSLESDNVVQAYVFVGLKDLGKFTLALAFANNLQGNPQGFNSDLHILQLENGQKNISIEETRKFIKTLTLSSFSNSYKVGIIRQAEALTPSAQSALLKTLEEPQDKVVIILLTEDEHALPETILSRCQILYFYPVSEVIIYDYLISTYSLNRSQAKNLASLALGRPLSAVNFLENHENYDDYLQKAETWLELLRQDIDDRLISLDKIFKDKTFSKLALDSAREILLMAEGLSRDLLLLSLGRDNIIQHSALLPTLTETLEFLNKQNDGDSIVLFLNHFKLIAQGREYLESNINPHLILERIIINL